VKKKGQFEYPMVIYLHTSTESSNHYLFVGDQQSVQIFDKMGQVFQRLGTSKGSKEGQFNEVQGLCVSHNTLYVSDSGNNRIQVFKLL